TVSRDIGYQRLIMLRPCVHYSCWFCHHLRRNWVVYDGTCTALRERSARDPLRPEPILAHLVVCQLLRPNTDEVRPRLAHGVSACRPCRPSCSLIPIP